MTRAEFRIQLVKKGKESAHLDDIVHEAASALASDANNGGIDAQIDFLVDTCQKSYDDILSDILNNV